MARRVQPRPGAGMRRDDDGTPVVARISADAMTNPRAGASYYTIHIALAPDEIARLRQVKLMPGMLVKVFVRTGDRKVISYLMKPLTDQFARAFRECGAAAAQTGPMPVLAGGQRLPEASD